MPVPPSRLPGPAARRRHGLAVGLALLLAAAPSAAELRFEEGVASDPVTSAPLYRERHWTRYDNGQPRERLVLYLCPDGTAFGRKFVDYRQSTVAPAFEFTDQRSGYREGLRRTDGDAIVWFRETGRTEQASAVAAPRLVADAGFDAFIRAHWSELLAGRSLALSFAVPARLRSMDFRLRRVGQARVAGEAAHVFRLTLGGWLGLIAPHIDVAYGQQSRRLLRFEGLSNLRDDGGRRQLVARIEFPIRDQGGRDSDWQAAAVQPLRACGVRR